MLGWFLLLLHVCMGIDYPGGWDMDHLSCVDICKNASYTSPDYDFIMLDQLFMPQYCRDLHFGVDSTVTHQNVLPFPKGVQCRKSINTLFTIHGVWPSVKEVGKYPACCGHRPGVLPVEKVSSGMLRQLESLKWLDPTQDTKEALCSIYNHEYQKHATCLGDNTTFEAYVYVIQQLDMEVRDATEKVAALVDKPSVFVKDIEKLYGYGIQVYCSTVASGGENRLSSIRTCWQPLRFHVYEVKGLKVVRQDCPRGINYGTLTVCNREIPLNMHGY